MVTVNNNISDNISSSSPPLHHYQPSIAWLGCLAQVQCCHAHPEHVACGESALVWQHASREASGQPTTFHANTELRCATCLHSKSTHSARCCIGAGGIIVVVFCICSRDSGTAKGCASGVKYRQYHPTGSKQGGPFDARGLADQPEYHTTLRFAQVAAG